MSGRRRIIIVYVLTIAGTTPFDGSGEDKYTAGSWNYSGTDAIEWLVLKYRTNYGFYAITDCDTSGLGILPRWRTF